MEENKHQGYLGISELEVSNADALFETVQNNFQNLFSNS
jgi:hypothetical protein